MINKDIFLHICCGVCSSWPGERLKAEATGEPWTVDREPQETRPLLKGFFYNPNIYPREEYDRRLGVARQVADILGFELIEGPYDHEAWLKAVAGLESEKEGGARCSVCYEYRLKETAKIAAEHGIEHFTTTLTVSRHKNSKVINEIGKKVGADSFLPYDFKKMDGAKKTSVFARAHDLYCQRYCGCEFSNR